LQGLLCDVSSLPAIAGSGGGKGIGGAHRRPSIVVREGDVAEQTRWMKREYARRRALSLHMPLDGAGDEVEGSVQRQDTDAHESQRFKHEETGHRHGHRHGGKAADLHASTIYGRLHGRYCSFGH